MCAAAANALIRWGTSPSFGTRTGTKNFRSSRSSQLLCTASFYSLLYFHSLYLSYLCVIPSISLSLFSFFPSNFSILLFFLSFYFHSLYFSYLLSLSISLFFIFIFCSKLFVTGYLLHLSRSIFLIQVPTLIWHYFGCSCAGLRAACVGSARILSRRAGTAGSAHCETKLLCLEFSPSNILPACKWSIQQGCNLRPAISSLTYAEHTYCRSN